MKKPEFKIGDTVHFRAYIYHPKEGIKAKIKEIRCGSGGGGTSLITSDPDDRIFYSLTGDVETLTLGHSIIESRYYKKPTY